MMVKWFLTASIATTMALCPAQASSRPDAQNPQIDYRGFVELGNEVEAYRRGRLVDLEKFKQLAARSEALVLDTRSADAFRRGHIAGAVNLPFSDFTEEKLAAVIGDRDRPILIYCNNNFSDNRRPIKLKSAPLALNIPTFINLYGYGYRNIHELADIVSIHDPNVGWRSAPLTQR